MEIITFYENYFTLHYISQHLSHVLFALCGIFHVEFISDQIMIRFDAELRLQSLGVIAETRMRSDLNISFNS